MPVSHGELRSHINIFAPNTSSMNDFMVEEVVSEDLGILPGFQGGSKGESIADDVEESGSENGDDEDVYISDVLVCQPCDEDVEVEGKTNSRSKERRRETRIRIQL